MVTSESTRVRNSVEQPIVLFPALTVEVGVYIMLALIALAVRLLALDAAPLAADEASQALASWNFINGRAFTSTASPLLFSADALLFALTGGQDVTVRLLPALFGTLLVIIPSLLRSELGKSGALIASGLLVFSPSIVFFSRNGNGAIIAVTCSLAALVFGWRYVTDRRIWYLYLGAAAAAMALLAAREVWTIILAIAVFFVAKHRQLRAVPNETEAAAGMEDSAPELVSRLILKRAGLIFLAMFFLLSTAFMFYRSGIGSAFDLFGSWINGLVPGGSPLDPLRILVVYEPLSLFFGIAALLNLAKTLGDTDQENVGRFALAIWVIVAFVLYSVGGDKNPARVVVILVPLILLAGWYIGHWFENVVAEYGEYPDGLVLLLSQELPVYAFAMALAGFIYFVLAEFATRGSVLAAELVSAMFGLSPTPGLTGAVLTALIAVAVAAIAFLASTTLGWDRARHLGAALALTLFTLWTVRQTALTSFNGEWNPQEWLVARATSANVRDLVLDLQDLSRWRANDARTLAILVDESTGPVIQWYLRDFRNARFASHPSMLPEVQALIVPPNTPVNATKLMSQKYRVEAVSAETPPALIQWLFFRQAGTIDYTGAVLWAPQPQ